jgi:hypothetical protein
MVQGPLAFAQHSAPNRDALDRLRRLPGGRIAYRIKKLRGGARSTA